LKEIVQRILETEKEVRESIEKARADAQDIVREAEDKSGEIEDAVREKAMHEAQEIAERMKKEAEAERQGQIAAARGGSESLLKTKGASVKEVAERVTNLVLGIEQKQGRLL
jgi:vacuolar-type H+-ATPase subunit H